MKTTFFFFFFNTIDVKKLKPNTFNQQEKKDELCTLGRLDADDTKLHIKTQPQPYG